MKPFLLRVDRPFAELEPLVAALRQAGERCGWLEYGGPERGPGPPSLEEAARGGVLRAVAVGDGGSVAVKPMRGAPVLRDVLREHFRGCRLVLVRGRTEGYDPPLLAPAGAAWKVTPAGEPTARQQTPPEILAELRRPRPWGVEPPGR